MRVLSYFVLTVLLVGRAVAGEASPLRLSDNGRFLVDAKGAPVFLLSDTAWSLVNQLRRDDISFYLEHRRAQGFNAVTFVLYATGDSNQADSGKNIYGCAPFALTDGRPDPTRPLVTPGADPAQPGEYDYWDHAAFALAETRRLGMYAIVLPCWGSATVGGYRGERTRNIIFNERNARAYGRWLGARWADQPHVVWMLGGDRSAAYADHPDRDYRAVFRAMAEGLRQGGGDRHTLMSFHPQKGGASQAAANPQSSAWFHQDDWLSFNSIQLWPEHQAAAIAHDWQLTPPKPTWLFEPRYEGYWKKPYKAADWGEWQTRQQAYQSVFAGGFGFTYGHERVFGFGKDGWDWKKELDAPGAAQMRHLRALMSRWDGADFLLRVPDHSLIADDAGRAGRLTSNRLTATRTGSASRAMIYNANGREMHVRMETLHGPAVCVYWFNPRTGRWRVGETESAQAKPFARDIAAGVGAATRSFTPPGGEKDGNDWILVIEPAS